jgi:hypothetical protein
MYRKHGGIPRGLLQYTRNTNYNTKYNIKYSTFRILTVLHEGQSSKTNVIYIGNRILYRENVEFNFNATFMKIYIPLE